MYSPCKRTRNLVTKQFHFITKLLKDCQPLINPSQDSKKFGFPSNVVTPDNASSEDKMSLVMGLYKDQSFSKPLVGDPSLNNRLYVEVGLNMTNSSSETTFRIKLNECYVTSKNSLAKYKYLLIERG